MKLVWLRSGRSSASPPFSLRSESPLARSLKVNHQEKPTVNPLLIAFLVVAVSWMLIGAAFSAADSAEPAATGTDVAGFYVE